MTTYRLLALDMDGTLLDSNKQVLPRTRDAVNALASRGVAVAYSTGRNPTELSDYREELPGIRYGSCVSGGLVYDFSRERAIFARSFRTDLALEVLALGAEEGAMASLLCTDAGVARPDDIRHMEDFHMGVYQAMYERLYTRSDDLAEYVRSHPDKVCKINLYHRDAASRRKTRKRLEGAGLPVQLADAEATSLEVSPAGVSKAEGLQKLCGHLGISLEETVAVGDAPNDTQALRVAGLAVAMGNATPDIKALADVVVADNDHDGVAEVVERFFS